MEKLLKFNHKKTTHKGVVGSSLSTACHNGQFSIRFDEMLSHPRCNNKKGNVGIWA